MYRWSISSLGTVLVCSAVLVGAQDARSPKLLTSDLVAWSSMQQPTAPEQNQTRPQPTPEPAPETQPSPQPTPPKPGQSSPSSAGSQGQAAAADTFTGTISKEADGFSLKVSGSTSYKLDNQQVQQYQGQRVRVTGTLDATINLIHVDKIEPLS